MTIQTWFWPAIWAGGMLGLSWALTIMPTPWSLFVRVLNGFVLLAIMVWVVRRILSYENVLRDHRHEILELMRMAEVSRNEAIQSLTDQTAHIAQDLAATSARSLADARKHADKRADQIEAKIDAVAEAAETIKNGGPP